MKPKPRTASPHLVHAVVIIYAIVILTGFLLAASNYPVQWKAETDRERQRNLEVYRQALEYYAADHDGALPTLPHTAAIISQSNTCRFRCPSLNSNLACFDLNSALVPDYLKALPQDPLLDSNEDSGFFILSAGDALTIGACYKFFNTPLTATMPIPK